MHYISPLVKEKKKFRPVIFRGAESKMAAYMEFETGHTFDPSKSSPVYRSVVVTKHDSLCHFHSLLIGVFYEKTFIILPLTLSNLTLIC